MPPILDLYQGYSNKDKISQKLKLISILKSTQSIHHLPIFIKVMEPIIEVNELDALLKKHNYE